MSFQIFLKLVQLYTKGNSIFPFMLGTLFAWYHYQSIHLGYLVLFFVAMLLFNMFVDAHDNYLDYKTLDKLNTDPLHPKPNIIRDNNVNIKIVQTVLALLVISSAIIGLFIAIKVGQPVLWLGIFSFAVGYLYSGGPYPISSTPFGEFFSGFTMGSVIFLLAVFINVYDIVDFNWTFVYPILISSGLAATAIGNVLLANNTADHQKDIKLGRRTIVYFLGVKKSIYLMIGLYILGFVLQIIAIILGYLPTHSLITILLIPHLYKTVHNFYLNPDKKLTFVPIAYNAFYLMALQILGLSFGIIF